MSLVLHQLRFDQKVFWRNPAAVFFTVLFPVLLLLIFAVVFGDAKIADEGGIEATTYYVPAIITLAVISATMQTLAMTVVIAREDGRLKRGRGTPMPACARHSPAFVPRPPYVLAAVISALRERGVPDPEETAKGLLPGISLP